MTTPRDSFSLQLKGVGDSSHSTYQARQDGDSNVIKRNQATNEMHMLHNLHNLHTIFFLFILNIKIHNDKRPTTLPARLLYDSTKTVPGGAIYHDFRLAFEINPKQKTKTQQNLPMQNAKSEKNLFTNKYFSWFHIKRYANRIGEFCFYPISGFVLIHFGQ